MVFDHSAFCIPADSVVRDAINALNFNQRGIVLIVDDQMHLVGTITDGDIRRAMLAEKNLDTPISELLAQRVDSPYPKPVTAQKGTESSEILRMMKELVVQQIPIIDKDDRIIDLVSMEELLPGGDLPVQAVIMAGGFGTRLRPLTEDLPKPMLPLGDRPIMERIIEQLRQTGINRVSVTTNYLGEKIKTHFGDGSEFGVDINYVDEDKPLGTAGSLGLMESPDEPLLVINGDILTRVDFRSMLNYHQKYNADLTVAVRQYDISVPYGVIEGDGPYVRRLREKPRYSFFVNAGIYLLDPPVHAYIKGDKKLDMTDLINILLQDERTVINFPVMEYWLDIGQPPDYQQAQEDFKNGRI